jgi:hypothetical protein
MHLIQILLPLADNRGAALPDETLRSIHRELSNAFGGLTVFSRAPAKGVWKENGADAHDDIVIIEVMAKSLDKAWWRSFRLRTESLLRQDKLVVRSYPITEL